MSRISKNANESMIALLRDIGETLGVMQKMLRMTGSHNDTMEQRKKNFYQ